MSRRCLICANINPCREHSGRAQEAELDRNSREVRRIVSDRATGAMDKAAVNGLNPALGHADGCGAHDDYACDCGKALAQPEAGVPAGMVLEREDVAQGVWTDFLDANPDDLTSPEDLPDHALVTFDQFYRMVREYHLALNEQATPTDEAVLGEREACALLAQSRAMLIPSISPEAAIACLESLPDAIRARPAPGSIGEASDV